MQINSEFNKLPIETWPLILKETKNPSLLTVCKLFHKIYKDVEVIWVLKELNIEISIEKNNLVMKEVARVMNILVQRVQGRPEKTYQALLNTKNLHYLALLKVKKEEEDLNLIKLYEKLPIEKKDFSNLSLHPQAQSIREFLDESREKLAKIEELNLFNSDLSLIPRELDLFTGIRSLNLMGNYIDTLPSTLGLSWKELKEINLSNNKLTAIPEGFGLNWTKLKEFTINMNKLSTLPDDFGSTWGELNSIYMNYNYLITLPNDFGINWNKLWYIDLSNNKLKTLPLKFGTSWKGIEFLNIDQNFIDGKFLKAVIDSMPNLII